MPGHAAGSLLPVSAGLPGFPEPWRPCLTASARAVYVRWLLAALFAAVWGHGWAPSLKSQSEYQTLRVMVFALVGFVTAVLCVRGLRLLEWMSLDAEMLALACIALAFNALAWRLIWHLAPRMVDFENPLSGTAGEDPVEQ